MTKEIPETAACARLTQAIVITQTQETCSANRHKAVKWSNIDVCDIRHWCLLHSSMVSVLQQTPVSSMAVNISLMPLNCY